jgi:hypothetical protein
VLAIFTRNIQSTLLGTLLLLKYLHLRGYHPLWRDFPEVFSFIFQLILEVRTPHFPTFAGGIRFALFPFHSPLLRESLLFSFPPPTKMFQFGGFPYLSVCHYLFCNDRRSHSEIPGSQPTCSSPGRIAACHVLLRHPLPSHPLHGVVAVWCSFKRSFFI